MFNNLWINLINNFSHHYKFNQANHIKAKSYHSSLSFLPNQYNPKIQVINQAKNSLWIHFQISRWEELYQTSNKDFQILELFLIYSLNNNLRRFQSNRMMIFFHPYHNRVTILWFNQRLKTFCHHFLHRNSAQAILLNNNSQIMDKFPKNKANKQTFRFYQFQI